MENQGQFKPIVWDTGGGVGVSFQIILSEFAPRGCLSEQRSCFTFDFLGLS